MRMPAARGRDKGGLRSALIVSGSERGREQLRQLLEGGDYRPTVLVGNGGEARRALLSAGADLLLINTPLPDEPGLDLACDAAVHGVGVILLVRAELLAEAQARVSPSGVVTLGKPLSKEWFHEALSLLEAFQVRAERLEGENRKLRAKLDEVKLVCRAKCLLVGYRGLTESEAHKLLEREAMDRQITRRTVAEEVIAELEG